MLIIFISFDFFYNLVSEHGNNEELKYSLVQRFPTGGPRMLAETQEIILK